MSVATPWRPVTAFAADGVYTLRMDLVEENVAPNQVFGTKLSFVSVKPLHARPPPADASSSPGTPNASSPAGQSAQSSSSASDSADDAGGTFSLRRLRGKSKNALSAIMAAPKAVPFFSFIAKSYTNPELASHIKYQNPPIPGGVDNIYMVMNVNNSLVLCDYADKVKEPLDKLTFNRTRPISHDINQMTRGHDHLDVIAGFTKGDLFHHDVLHGRSAHLNRDGIFNSFPVMCVRWVPGSETRFIAAFLDGVLMVMDVRRDDPPSDSASLQALAGLSDSMALFHQRNEACNPIAAWCVSKSIIMAIAFSPDCEHLAVASKDGFLRIYHFHTQALVIAFRSYFGGLTCVCWSPDGKYLVTGGEDDLVSVWDFHNERLVARGEGHLSWVSDVAFDPWKCDENNYRFASVGEDTRLLMWDFSVSALRRPRASTSLQARRNSIRRPSLAPSDTPISRDHPSPPFIEAPLFREVAVMEPIMSKCVHADPISSVAFREDGIVTACRRGRVKVWQRHHVTLLIAAHRQQQQQEANNGNNSSHNDGSNGGNGNNSNTIGGNINNSIGGDADVRMGKNNVVATWPDIDEHQPTVRYFGAGPRRVQTEEGVVMSPPMSSLKEESSGEKIK